MTLLDKIFAEPELLEIPPVLVDVGAAGGMHRVWRRIARYAIGVGFEPDGREAAPLGAAQRMFKRWIFCPALAVPTAPADGKTKFYLTKSPQCSSALAPKPETLREWAFADFFIVKEARALPAMTIEAALRANGLKRIDWLKCDTQGLDLQLYASLPESWRARLLAVEFEPGLIDAYDGEDKCADVLGAMAREPFWLAELEVGRTLRGRRESLAREMGAQGVAWTRRVVRGTPAWVNARFLRDVAQRPGELDRRAYLLAWVFATLSKQHGPALITAELGRERFGGELFGAMMAASAQSLRWAMARGLPAWLWRRCAEQWR